MASVVLKNAYVSLGGSNVSTYVKSITFPVEQAAVDETTMGMTTHSNLPGLKNWNLSIDFRTDMADNLLDEILHGSNGTNGLFGTVFAIELRTDTGTVTASNPKWTASGMITSAQVFGGAVGDLSMSPITIVPAGGSAAAIARAVS